MQDLTTLQNQVYQMGLLLNILQAEMTDESNFWATPTGDRDEYSKECDALDALYQRFVHEYEVANFLLENMLICNQI